MSDTEIYIRLTCVAILGGFICYRYWRRERQALLREFSSQVPGHAMDVGPLKPAVAQARQLMADKPRVFNLKFHHQLLAWARLAIMRLNYFQGRS